MTAIYVEPLTQGVRISRPVGIDARNDRTDQKIYLEIASPLEKSLLDLKRHALARPEGAELCEPSIFGDPHPLLQIAGLCCHFVNALSTIYSQSFEKWRNRPNMH